MGLAKLASRFLLLAGLGAHLITAEDNDGVCQQVSCDYDHFPDMGEFDNLKMFPEGIDERPPGNLREQRRK